MSDDHQVDPGGTTDGEHERSAPIGHPVPVAAPRVSVVMPAYNEGENITAALTRLDDSVLLPREIVVVVDFAEDTTVPVVQRLAGRINGLRCVVSDYGRGPANAIRYGVDHATAPTTVVTMADGCDDPRQIDDLTRLVERGVVVAAASRYMPGGQQVGGPLLKSTMSRVAGRSLHLFARIGTRDATNSFKAYSTAFVREVGIDSRDGFEIGLELTAKARRLGRPVAEIPTIWLDRQAGVSNFKLAKWIPHYLRWYRFAFGKRVDVETLRAEARAVVAAGAGPTAPSGVSLDAVHAHTESVPSRPGSAHPGPTVPDHPQSGERRQNG